MFVGPRSVTLPSQVAGISPSRPVALKVMVCIAISRCTTPAVRHRLATTVRRDHQAEGSAVLAAKAGVRGDGHLGRAARGYGDPLG